MSVFKAGGNSGRRRLGPVVLPPYYAANRDLPLSRRIYRLDGGNTTPDLPEAGVK